LINSLPTENFIAGKIQRGGVQEGVTGHCPNPRTGEEEEEEEEEEWEAPTTEYSPIFKVIVFIIR
jgi:hypothetical protein